MTDQTTKHIEATGHRYGYAHVEIWGTCSPDVTVEDIKAKFYHENFGGRQARVEVRDGVGHFSCIRHTD